MITVLVHIANSDPVKCDIDEMPTPSDSLVIAKNPRDRGDKEVTFLEDGVTTVVFPWWRITFIEILPSAEAEDEFPLPFRLD
jgi:hypothetical protein